MFRTSRIMRYINQNKRQILFVIGAVVGLIIVIQLLNSFAKIQLNNGETTQEVSSQGKKIYNPNKTILANTTVGETQAKENSKIIKEFVSYCNIQEIQKAYDLLTDECKEVLYPTLEKFNQNYCQKVFNGQKTYNIQSWMTKGKNYTYKVRFLEDILATGKYNIEALEDYITIVNNGNIIKININSYIAREKINKEKESQNLKISVIHRDVYKSYEEYKIKVTNNSNEDILLDSLETVDGIKLIKKEGKVTYQALTNEITEYDLEVPSKNTKIVKIRFSRDYNPAREVDSIQFSNIIMNKEDKNNKTSIEVELK